MPSNRSQKSSVIIIELLIMVNTIRREQIHDQKWQCSICLTVFRFNWKRCSMFRWKICIECPYIVSFVLFSLFFSLVRLHLCPVISFFFFSFFSDPHSSYHFIASSQTRFVKINASCAYSPWDFFFFFCHSFAFVTILRLCSLSFRRRGSFSHVFVERILLVFNSSNQFSNY